MTSVKQHIFLSGSVGVGKTTAIKTFDEVYGNFVNCIVIKEYIDYDGEGLARLTACQAGDITLFDFQIYIMDMLEQQLNCDDYDGAKVVIWERHPEEALEIFSCEMDKEDKKKLKSRLELLSQLYGFPMLSERKGFQKLTFNTLDVSDMFVADVMYDIIKASLSEEARGKVPRAMYVFLYIPNFNLEEHYKRIVKRGRTCEIEKYKNLINLANLNLKYLKFIESIGK